MSEEERSKQEEESPNLIKKYEQMLLHDENWYFDLDQFETIVEYYFEENEYNRALEALEYAKTIFNSSYELLILEAQINIAIGRLTKSILILKEVLNLQPTNDEAHVMLASLYSQLRQSEKAIFHLEKALDYSDEFLKDELYLDLALEYENMDEYKNAIEVLRQALISNPENEAGIYEMAFCFEELDKIEMAVSYFTSFIDENPYSFPAWYSLGNMYLKQKKYQEAITSYDFCTSIQEDFTPALINLATSYMLVGAYEHSIATLDEAIAVEGENEEILCFIGECYEKMDRPEDALKYFNKALILKKNYPEAVIGKSIAFVELGRTLEALPILQDSYVKNSDNIELALILADVCSKLELFDRSEELYDEILEKFPKESKVREAIFDYYFVYLKDYYIAYEFVIDSVFHFPDNKGLENRRMIVLFALGKRKEGMVELHHLLEEESFDKEQTMELYPILFEDPGFNELIKS